MFRIIMIFEFGVDLVGFGASNTLYERRKKEEETIEFGKSFEAL